MRKMGWFQRDLERTWSPTTFLILRCEANGRASKDARRSSQRNKREIKMAKKKVLVVGLGTWG
jgi:hypothetical protein